LGSCCTNSMVSVQKVSITADGASAHASCEMQSSPASTAGRLFLGLGGPWSIPRSRNSPGPMTERAWCCCDV
jgi:hypothetical protein